MDITELRAKRAAYMREWLRKNSERVNAERRAKRANDPEKYRAAEKANYWSKPEIKRQNKRDDYARHREERLEWHRRYQAENPELRRSYGRKRYAEKSAEYKSRARAREKALTGNYSQADTDALYRVQNGLCAGCRRELSAGYEVDHVMPVSRGGSNTPDNLQLLCKPCNRRKTDMSPDEWAQRLGKLFV